MSKNINPLRLNRWPGVKRQPCQLFFFSISQFSVFKSTSNDLGFFQFVAKSSRPVRRSSTTSWSTQERSLSSASSAATGTTSAVPQPYGNTLWEHLMGPPVTSSWTVTGSGLCDLYLSPWCLFQANYNHPIEVLVSL